MSSLVTKVRKSIYPRFRNTGSQPKSMLTKLWNMAQRNGDGISFSRRSNYHPAIVNIYTFSRGQLYEVSTATDFTRNGNN